jgi:hypothetical protein
LPIVQRIFNGLGWRLIDVRIALVLLALLAMLGLVLVEGNQLRHSSLVQDLRAFLFDDAHRSRDTRPARTAQGAATRSASSLQSAGGTQGATEPNPIHPIQSPRGTAQAVRQALADYSQHPDPGSTSVATVSTQGRMELRKGPEQTAMGGIPIRELQGATQLQGGGR